MKRKGILDKTVEVECPGCYASHWGLTDLYPETEELLRKLLDSGEDFRTTWWGAKKEIVYAQYEADGDELSVTVQNQMDDLWDGSHDLIWDAIDDLKYVDKKLPADWEADDDFTDFVLECINDWNNPMDIEDSAISITILPRTTTYENLMEAVSKTWDDAYNKCQTMYNELKELILYCYSFEPTGKEN